MPRLELRGETQEAPRMVKGLVNAWYVISVDAGRVSKMFKLELSIEDSGERAELTNLATPYLNRHQNAQPNSMNYSIIC
jgi:hypothetical protein